MAGPITPGVGGEPTHYVRCGAMRTASNSGARCNKPAMPDSDPPRCEQHFEEYTVKDGGMEGKKHMHRYYYRRLKPEMAQAIAENLDGLSIAEQLDVTGELVMIRQRAGDMVEAYGKACQLPGDSATRAEVGAMMSAAMQDVLRAVDSMARVETVKMQVSGQLASAMQSVIAAVVAAASEAFENDHRVTHFEALLKDKIRELAASGRGAGVAAAADGTLITPDQDVTEMDALVPDAPADS